MTQDEKPENKTSPLKLLLFVALIVVFVGLIIAIKTSRTPKMESYDVQAESLVVPVDGKAEAKEDAAQNQDDMNIPPRMMSYKVMGKPDAPIKIMEFISLSCTYCAKFHHEIFPAFKKQYIDTGKAQVVFVDYPLNAPALAASMLSRCVRGDKYFNFIGDVMSSQPKWLEKDDYLLFFKALTAKYGLPAEKFEPCVKNEDVATPLLQKVKAMQMSLNIRTTPSFLVNGKVVVTAAATFEEFEQKILDAAKAIEEGKVPDQAQEQKKEETLLPTPPQ
jgi:protein-disulfide isomerase